MSADFNSAKARLRSSAALAGLDPEIADQESQAAASVVCPFANWVGEFGGTSRDYAAAQTIGAGFTRARTGSIAMLMEAGRVDDAQNYALALVDLVTEAACLDPDLSLDRINTAGFVANTQLQAAHWRPPTQDFGAPETLATPTGQSLRFGPPDAPELADSTGPTQGTAPTETTPTTAPASPASPVSVPPRSLQDLLAELDALVGLGTVKEEVHRQAALLRLQAIRQSRGLKTPEMSRHLVFVGNPGTGKTTVARLVAEIYRAIGLLENGQLIETDRSGLVAGYEGQTALKTASMAESAIGGVLFVDEAYALAGDQFGQEAIDTLVKAMEDHRSDLVVVAAGYPEEMREFLDSNPGLASRFPTVIEFSDYTDEELVSVLIRMCASSDFTMTPAFIEGVKRLLADSPRDKGFGNGRMVRNLFEAAISRQAWRLRDVETPTDEQLREILEVDLDDPAAGP